MIDQQITDEFNTAKAELESASTRRKTATEASVKASTELQDSVMAEAAARQRYHAATAAKGAAEQDEHRKLVQQRTEEAATAPSEAQSPIASVR